MKKLLFFLLSLFILLVVILLWRTYRFEAPQYGQEWELRQSPADPALLAEALRFPTISHKAGMVDDSSYLAFHQFLMERFPLMHAQLKPERPAGYSLIFSWPGQKPDLEPVLLLAHQDVVPVEYSTRKQWSFPAFDGAMDEKFIYGRGAIDDKGSLIALCQAIENLLMAGYQPERSIVLAFGHDEEIGGNEGAARLSELLQERYDRFWMVLDEGGTLSSGIVPGIERPVALVGTSEKGYLSLELSVDLPGGHSSMPEERNALRVLNQAVYRLEQNPLPDQISPPIEGFIKHVGPELPFIQRMAFANTWLFEPLIFNTYRKTAAGAALVHSTQVVTMFNGGLKDNVVPTRANAVVNYRLLPGDTPAAMQRRAEEIIADSSVRVVPYGKFASKATAVSPYNSDQFRFLAAGILAVHPEAVVSPYLVLGGTDARHYGALSDHIFRFSPVPLSAEDLPRIHGINERISREAYQQCVNFYATLLGHF